MRMPTREPVLGTPNTRKHWREDLKTKKRRKQNYLKKEEEERRSKLEREKFLALGETCMAMLIVSFSRI